MDQLGQAQRNYLSEGVSESGAPRRPSATGESVQPSGTPARPAMSAAELRLRAGTELRERDRDEVCRQVRRRCEAYVASMRVETVARKPQADGLVSEVVAHLLRATSLGKGESLMNRIAPQTSSPGASASDAAA